jgi:regulator of protease activity HflC (stomatin/prohibitin superfamily)
MDSALAWIGQIASWIGNFIPRWVILDTTEGAVKYVRGHKAIALGPGIHWYWPVVTSLTHYPTAFQADRLQTQTLVTTDDKVIIVGAMVSYSVTDILPLVAGTHSAQTTVKNLAMTAVHDVCCRMSWEELKGEQRKGTLDTKLRNMAQRMLTKYGVHVEQLTLIDLAPARVLKLMQSTSNEEG